MLPPNDIIVSFSVTNAQQQPLRFKAYDTNFFSVADAPFNDLQW